MLIDNIFTPTVYNGFCIHNSTPYNQNVAPCNCFKRRFEFLYNLKIVRIEICRDWYNYMVTGFGIIKTFEVLGYTFTDELFETNKTRIRCHSDLPLFQMLHISDVLDADIISLLRYDSYDYYYTKTKHLLSYAKSKVIDFAESYLKKHKFYTSKASSSRTRNSTLVNSMDKNKIDLLIKIINSTDY